MRNSAPKLTIRKQEDSHNLWVILLQIVTMVSFVINSCIPIRHERFNFNANNIRYRTIYLINKI